MTKAKKARATIFGLIMAVVLCAALTRIAHHPALTDDTSSVVEYKTIVVKTNEGEKTYEHINGSKINEPNVLNGSLRFEDEEGNKYHFEVNDYVIKSDD